MKMSGQGLTYQTGVIKPRSGDIAGGLLTVDDRTSLMTIGNAKFPMLPTGTFTPEANGTIVQSEGRLLIAIDYQWYTPNVISLLVSSNPGAGQQAVFTVQHGFDSRILTNVAQQETTVLHTATQPVNITAGNFSTGAVGYTAVTPSVSGQAYIISSNSVISVEGSVTQVGSLQTIGELKEIGELIQSGELTGKLMI
jgi:hypothetical protein